MSSNTRPRLNGAQEEIRPGMECCQQLETISICIAFTHPSNSPSERCKKVLWVWRDVRLRCPCQVFIAHSYSLLFATLPGGNPSLNNGLNNSLDRVGNRRKHLGLSDSK